MFGKYAATAFEVEAERRREVIAGMMRDARLGSRKANGEGDECAETDRWTLTPGRRLAWLATLLFGRMGQRV